jgi:ubiquinone biosynthesis protein COQ9
MTTADDDRRRLLAAFLPHAGFDGWSDKALRQATADTGLQKDDVRLLFPKGMRDILSFHLNEHDRAFEANPPDLTSLNIRARIATLVKARILLLEPYREAERRAMLTLALPAYADIGVSGLWRVADLLWRMAGDTATDWNHYSKRAILSGVYSSTLLAWFSDHSENYAETWDFLDRRIAGVMKIEKAKAEMRRCSEKLPSIPHILGRLRYPRLES